MAAASKHHDLLVLAGGGAAALAGYQFILKPLLARLQGGGALPNLLGGPFAISTPSIVGGTGVYSPVTGPGGSISIVDPRVTPGGLVGQVMYRKNWTQVQAQARLDQLMTACRTATAQIAALSVPGANPAAAGVAAAQAQIQANQVAANTARQRAAQDLANGDTAGAANWSTAAASHEQDIVELSNRVSAGLASVDNSAAVAAYQGALAGYKANWLALTGQNLVCS